MGYSFDEDIFVIDCWIDTKEKEQTLLNLINRVKVYNVPILLCGHSPVSIEVQKQVDYFLFDKNNNIQLEKDFNLEIARINSRKFYSVKSIINLLKENRLK